MKIDLRKKSWTCLIIQTNANNAAQNLSSDKHLFVDFLKKMFACVCLRHKDNK